MSTHPTAGWIWSSLGALYTEAKRQSEAAVCFKQAAKLDGSVSKDVRHWYYVGPFPIGKSETDGDPLEAYGGIKNASVHRFDSDFYMLSEIAPLGKVRWSILNQKSSNGYVNVAPNMPWSELVNSLGSTGIMEWQGWAVGEISVNVAETAVLVKCMGVTNLFIDTQPVAGDVYHREQYKFAVRLSVGIHTVYVKTRAKANLAFRCDFDVANTAFEFHAPHFLPDLHDGHFFSGYMSFPVANHHASKWLRNIRLTLEDVQEPNKFRLKTRKSDFAIAPGQTRLVSAELVAESSTVSTKCNDVPLTVKLSTSEGQKSQQITLRCRKRHESFLFTFVDHDGSVQHAAVIRPVEQQCKQRLCPVVLTLHGTTVPPQNQADSYKRMINSQFVFGFQHAWLLAPTRLALKEMCIFIYAD